MNQTFRKAPLARWALAAAALAGAAQAWADGPGATRGFVLTNVYWASDARPDACPSQTLSALDVYLRSLPARERAQYEQPGNPGFSAPEQRQPLTRRFHEAMGFKKLWIAKLENPMAGGPRQVSPAAVAGFRQQLGLPPGKGDLAFLNTRFDYDSCTDPEDFPTLADGLALYGATVAAGLNLDGAVGPEDFTGADGERGIDNQLWRLLGCIWSVRDNANPQEAAARIVSSRAPTLVQLTGVDDLRHDDHVRIDIHTSEDPVVLAADGRALHGATYTALARPELHAVGSGRIVEGVLISGAMDLRLSYREQIVDTVRDLRQARLRIEFMPDGSVKGQIAGYQTVDSIWEMYKQSTQAAADQTGYSCPAIHAALPRLADGLPDPDTGENRGLSAAFDFVGVPAFVAPPLAAAGGAESPASKQREVSE